MDDDEPFFPEDMWSHCLEREAKPPVIAETSPILHNAADLDWLFVTIEARRKALGE